MGQDVREESRAGEDSSLAASAEDVFRAVVTDIRLESRVGGVARWQMVLDRTLFSAASPEGELVAVAPSGARLEVPVISVVEEDGVVWHVVDKPLTEGTEVVGRRVLPRKA